jgi:hypothetical protein
MPTDKNDPGELVPLSENARRLPAFFSDLPSAVKFSCSFVPLRLRCAG